MGKPHLGGPYTANSLLNRLHVHGDDRAGPSLSCNWRHKVSRSGRARNVELSRQITTAGWAFLSRARRSFLLGARGRLGGRRNGRTVELSAEEPSPPRTNHGWLPQNDEGSPPVPR